MKKNIWKMVEVVRWVLKWRIEYEEDYGEERMYWGIRMCEDDMYNGVYWDERGMKLKDVSVGGLLNVFKVYWSSDLEDGWDCRVWDGEIKKWIWW